VGLVFAEGNQMYPAHAAALFRPFPETSHAFVAMSFAEALRPRWELVIAPGLRDAGLDPIRVDVRRVSNSILTEILDGICRARLVFADVSSVDGVRNGNVMYELGIAHALRQPEEVILFRSDKDPLLFDLANVRVNSYDPDGDPAKSRAEVAAAASDALREVDLAKSITVDRAIEVLDDAMLVALLDFLSNPAAFQPHVDRTVGDILGRASRRAAIARLLEVGILKTRLIPIEPNMMDAPMEKALPTIQVYEMTSLGMTVLKRVSQQLMGGPVPPQWMSEKFAGPDAPS
jgi:hypothetical protein